MITSAPMRRTSPSYTDCPRGSGAWPFDRVAAVLPLLVPASPLCLGCWQAAPRNTGSLSPWALESILARNVAQLPPRAMLGTASIICHHRQAQCGLCPRAG